MSPSSTTEAFITQGEWNEHTRTHPVVNFFEKYNNFFNTSSQSPAAIAEWFSPDYCYQGQDGKRIEGRDKAWDELREKFKPFKARANHAVFAITVPWESDKSDGKKRWLLMALAEAYLELADGGSGGQSKVKDREGKEWDFGQTQAYRIIVVEDTHAKHDGFVIESVEIYGDRLEIFQGMKARGLIKESCCD